MKSLGVSGGRQGGREGGREDWEDRRRELFVIELWSERTNVEMFQGPPPTSRSARRP